MLLTTERRFSDTTLQDCELDNRVAPIRLIAWDNISPQIEDNMSHQIVTSAS
jgi:hypothetical protein